jgi:hypothetical protein
MDDGGCTNWFRDSKGVNRVLWPGFTWQYWRAVRNFDDTDFEFTPPLITREQSAAARIVGVVSARIAAFSLASDSSRLQAGDSCRRRAFSRTPMGYPRRWCTLA